MKKIPGPLRTYAGKALQKMNKKLGVKRANRQGNSGSKRGSKKVG